MIKGRSIPFLITFAFFLGFLILPAIKITYELIQLQRSVGAVSVIIQSEEKNVEELSDTFSKIGTIGTRISSDLNYPVWKLAAGLSGNTQVFSTIQRKIKEASILAPHGARLLGFSKPKSYMLVFQNPAEARGTGGIIGAYAIVTINRARFTVVQVGSNLDLRHMQTMPIEISSDFFFTYGDDPAIWQNSNMSPHFPYGARIWKALWKNQTGNDLDGILAVDPFVLKSILKVTGPLDLTDGTSISADNVVSETLSTVYERFDGRNLERKNYLVEIAQKTLDKLLLGGFSRFALGRELLSPYEDHRILFYSSETGPQRAIEKTLLGGSLDRGGKDYRLVIQNIAGNKMDYYLARELDIEVLECGVRGKTRVRAILTNRVSELESLSTYVKGRLDIGRPQGSANSHAISVFLYGPKGSELLSSAVVGHSEETSFSGHERGRSFFSAPIELSAGERISVEAEFEGGFPNSTTTVQPLVDPQKTQISNPCQ